MSKPKAIPFRQTEDGLQVPGGIIEAAAIRKMYVDPNVENIEDGVTLVNVSFFGVDADFDPMAVTGQEEDEGSEEETETPETPEEPDSSEEE